MASEPNQLLHTRSSFFFNVFTRSFVNFSPQWTTATGLWALSKISCIGLSVSNKITHDSISDWYKELKKHKMQTIPIKTLPLQIDNSIQKNSVFFSPPIAALCQRYSLIGWGCVPRPACDATVRRRRPPAPGRARGAPRSRESGRTCRPPAGGPRWSHCRAVWGDACSPAGEETPVHQCCPCVWWSFESDNDMTV